MVGSISMNFHEGSRAEYLAQFAFARFGTSVAVPHQEDGGLDLYCTLVERKGQLGWPKAYFAVQVKNNNEAWEFTNKQSVEWLVKFPLPLLLCVVDKATAWISVYHTSPRFLVWSLPPFPEGLKLVPGASGKGTCAQWTNKETYDLSAPILEFSVEQMLRDDFTLTIERVLAAWLDFDQQNIHRVKTGVPLVELPSDYETNSSKLSGVSQQYLTIVPEDILLRSLSRFKELLSWVIGQLHQKGDFGGAVRAAVLHRYLFANRYKSQELDENIRLASERFDINGQFCRLVNDRYDAKKYVYDGIDRIDKGIDRLDAEFSELVQ